jgi:PKD repeat protein
MKTNFQKKYIMLFSIVSLAAQLNASAQQNTNLINTTLASEQAKNGWAASDISDYIISDQYTDEQTGLTHTYVQQRHHRIIVYNAISVFLIQNNKVLAFTPGIVNYLDKKIKTDAPSVTAEAAIGFALQHLERYTQSQIKLVSTDNALNRFVFDAPEISASPVKVQLVYRAIGESVLLAWDVSIEMKSEPHWWNVRVNAVTGEYIDKNDFTTECDFTNTEIPAQFLPPPPPTPVPEYTVYVYPVEAPTFGGRSLITDPSDIVASPYGWHDVDGIAGNDYTITRGNNVHAYEDGNNDNLPGYAPDTSTLQFNYPINLANAPITNQDAAITNLFYANNRLHDVTYHAGFTAAAGNFQQNNYGNGGLGNDYVQAEAFDGGGTNNANFATPTDGNRPRMQMYLWSGTPQYDGSLDNGVIAHEFGHGVSNRLTGGPSNSSCLTNAEQGGEGWSDWLALIMTVEASDTGAGFLNQARGIGTYVKGQATSGAGIRRYRYSTNMSINPQTYADLAASSGPHAKGEIWCDAIWDMSSFLISDIGFNSDPTVTTSGNFIAMRLVLEGMKLQPCSPGYLDARDAILTADAVLYGNAHRCRIWEAFARRGMGFNAVQGSSGSSTDQTAGFLLPPVCMTATQPPVAAFTSNVSTVACAGTVQFTDQSVQAFSWLWNFGDATTSTQYNPTHQFNSPGTFTVKLVVTNPLGSDSVTHTITVTPTFTASVNATPTAVCTGSPVQLSAAGSGSANASSYTLSSIAFAPVTGTPIAGPTGDDIVGSTINIGFNFPFYSGVKTQLKITTNGFISFNLNTGHGCCDGQALPNSSTALDNMVAVCWTDLYPGGPGTVDYFNLTAPNRFVVRYNSVAHCCATTPAQVTAQIILYESGVIEMHNTSILSSTDFMTQGIENAGGTLATVVPGRNGVSFTAANDAYRFTPVIAYNYNWQPGNLNGANQTVTPASTGSYTVNVSDGSGCIIPFASPVITVNQMPAAATITAEGPTTFCAGGSVVLSGNANAGTWSVVGGTTSSVTATTSGDYFVTNSNSCGTATSNHIIVTVNPLPTVTANNVSGCAGTAIPLSGTPATGTWSVANPYTGSSTTYTHTYTNGNGCTNTSAAANITVNPLPTVSYTGLAASYNVSAPAATLTPSPAGGTFSGPGISGNTFTPSVAGIGGPYTITYTYTNGNGCTNASSQQTTVTGCVVPAQPGNISGPASVCHNQNNVIYSIAPVATATSYTWTVPPGTNLKTGQGTVQIKVRFGNSAGNITVKANNSCGSGPVRTLAIAMPCKEAPEDISSSGFDVTVYPNPTESDFIFLINSSSTDSYSINIFDVTGRIVEAHSTISAAKEFKCGAKLTDGIYFAEVVLAGEREVIKLVKHVR